MSSGCLPVGIFFLYRSFIVLSAVNSIFLKSLVGSTSVLKSWQFKCLNLLKITLKSFGLEKKGAKTRTEP